MKLSASAGSVENEVDCYKKLLKPEIGTLKGGNWMAGRQGAEWVHRDRNIHPRKDQTTSS
jgi:hypothetical protein